MRNCLFFCLNLVFIKLLVHGKFEVTSQDNNETIAIDLCALQPERGSCNKKIRRYYYNSLFKGCTYFTYSGCEDNPNSFHTKKECQENCPECSLSNINSSTATGGTLFHYGNKIINYDDKSKLVQSRQPLHCFNEPEKGPCDAHIRSFYYDWKTDKCEKFIYGGCHGNNNRFTSSDKCINECRTYEFNLQMNS